LLVVGIGVLTEASTDDAEGVLVEACGVPHALLPVVVISPAPVLEVELIGFGVEPTEGADVPEDIPDVLLPAVVMPALLPVVVISPAPVLEVELIGFGVEPTEGADVPEDITDVLLPAVVLPALLPVVVIFPSKMDVEEGVEDEKRAELVDVDVARWEVVVKVETAEHGNPE